MSGGKRRYTDGSPTIEAIQKKDGTVASTSDLTREGNSGGHADGVITEFINIGVGLSKAIYIKALKECSVNITGYVHSTLVESNKFSAVEAYFLGIEDADIQPTFGPGVADLMAPRNQITILDDVTASTLVKRPYSQNFDQPDLGIIEAKFGDYLTSDVAALTTFIHLPTTASPIVLDHDTVIASSQSQSSAKQVGFIYMNAGQNLLVVFTNGDSLGTNEANADVHISMKYAETNF